MQQIIKTAFRVFTASLGPGAGLQHSAHSQETLRVTSMRAQMDPSAPHWI